MSKKTVTKKTESLFDSVLAAFPKTVPTPGQIRTYVLNDLGKELDYDAARNLQRRVKTALKAQLESSEGSPNSAPVSRQRYSVSHG